jgi:hypothetical protein
VNLLPLFGLIVLVLASLLSPKNKMNSAKKKLFLLSFISTIIFAFLPTVGYQVDSDGNNRFGFPAEGVVYRGGSAFTYSSLGLLFNFFCFIGFLSYYSIYGKC